VTNRRIDDARPAFEARHNGGEGGDDD